MSVDASLDITQEVVDTHDRVSDVTSYLNISQPRKDKLLVNLPLDIRESEDMFNKGSFGVVSGEGGKRGEILLRSGNDPETWIEEITHYIQTAGNSSLLENAEKINELYEQSEKDILMSVGEPLVVADRARQIAIEELDSFALRINLRPTHSPQNSEEVAAAIRIKVGSKTPNGYFEGGTLSSGQAIQVVSQINSLLGKETGDAIGLDVNDYLLRSKALVKISDESLKDRKNEEIRVLRERQAESGKYISSNVAGRVTRLLDNSEDRTVENVFASSHIEIDGVRFRSGQISQQIDLLSNEQAKQCILNFMAQKCTASDLLCISQIIPGGWGKYYEALQNSSHEGLEAIQEDLIKDVLVSGDGKTSNNPQAVLRDLVKQTESISSARAGLETSLIYLMDDFPVDEEVKAAMLGNPEYVKAYINAALKALKSGEYTPLNIKLDSKEFSQSERAASIVAQRTLAHAFSEPEAVVFFQELYKKMDYERFRSSNADTLSMYGNWQLDMQFIADGIDLRRPIEASVYNKELQKARVKSLESIKRKQDMDTKRHLRDVLVEPIAKIVVAQKLGRDRASVVFPQNMLGGYSELLRSGDAEQWINDLWLFVEKVHTNKEEGEKMVFDFIACNSITEQQQVVNKYLKQKT